MGIRKGLIGALLVGALGLMALVLPGVAAAKDRNHDRIPDRWEKRHGLSLRANQAHRDQDHDGLVNRQEFRAGDDPMDADSDGDGTPDGQEDAGTIASFDGTTLTINLFGGQTISGTVTDATEVKCDNGDDQGDEDGDGLGGNSGSGGGDDKASHEGGDGPGDGQGDDDNANCSTADLVPGAIVQEANLRAENGDAVFEEIELAESQPPTGTN